MKSPPVSVISRVCQVLQQKNLTIGSKDSSQPWNSLTPRGPTFGWSVTDADVSETKGILVAEVTRHWGPYNHVEKSWTEFKHVCGPRPNECPYGCCILDELQWSGIFMDATDWPLAIKGWYWGIDGEDYTPTEWIRGIPQMRPRGLGDRVVTPQPDTCRRLRMSINCHNFIRLASEGAPLEEMWAAYETVQPDQIERCTWWLYTAILAHHGWTAIHHATRSKHDAVPSRVAGVTVADYLLELWRGQAAQTLRALA